MEKLKSTKHFQKWSDCNETIQLGIDKLQEIKEGLGGYMNPQLITDLESVMLSLEYAIQLNRESISHLFKHE